MSRTGWTDQWENTEQNTAGKEWAEAQKSPFGGMEIIMS